MPSREMFLTLQGEGVQAGRTRGVRALCRLQPVVGPRAGPGERDLPLLRHRFRRGRWPGGGRFAMRRRWSRRSRAFGASRGASASSCSTGASRCFKSTMRWSMRSCGGLLHRDREQRHDRAHPGIDWVCISPKAGSEVVQRSGQELKLVWPQAGIDPVEVEGWDFANHLLQPLDDPRARRNREACIAMVMERPRWRLTLQTHKMLGLRYILFPPL